jgi:hypothetical protein
VIAKASGLVESGHSSVEKLGECWWTIAIRSSEDAGAHA